MEISDREGIAQIQRIEACSDRKSRSAFSEHARVNIRAANVCNKRRESGWTGVRQKVVPPVKRKNWV
jgi:predicted metalloprotease